MSENFCEACPAACCRNVQMDLTDDERSFMQRAGSTLVTVVESSEVQQPDARYAAGYELDEDEKGTPIVRVLGLKDNETHPLRAKFGRYLLVGDCGNLVVSDKGVQFCGAYKDRPTICREFKAGGLKCTLIRYYASVTETQPKGLGQ